MTASVRPSCYHYVVDEPLLRSIAAEIQAAIPGAEVRLYRCAQARRLPRPRRRPARFRPGSAGNTW